MTIEQINARLAEIRTLCDDPNADIDALTKEAKELIAKRNQLTEAIERRNQLRDMIAGGAGTVITAQSFPAGGTVTPGEQRGRDSMEYRNAWLRHMARDNQGNMLLGEMTVEERAAFTFTTANTGSVVPTMILDQIVELVRSTSPLLSDATITNFIRGFGVPRHKSIKKGDAAVTAEGAAPADDEEDVFDLLPLDGEEIKKTIEMSKKMQVQSLEAFASWIVTNLSDRIRAAKERVIIVRLDDEEVGIAAENRLEGEPLSDALLRKAFGLLDANGIRSVYANHATIWNRIAGLTNEKGEKLFIPNSMEDPIVQGRVYGAACKADTEIADNVIYIGVGKNILANDFDELEVVPSIEPKTLKRIYTGYSLFDAGLSNPKSFAKLTLEDAEPAAAAEE